MGYGAGACGEAPSGNADELDCGDQVVIGFNQPVDPGSGPTADDSVCADTLSNSLRLGSEASEGECLPTENLSVGTLEGGEVDGCDCRFAAAYPWDAPGQTLTVTIGARLYGGEPTNLWGYPWTFKPTLVMTRLLLATGDRHVCDTDSGGDNCWPTTP